MIYPSHILLVAVAATFGLSLLNVWSSNRKPQTLLDPGTNEQPASLALNVDLPPIAPLSHYYGTDGDSWARFNPFIPLENRLAEERQLRQPRQRPPTIPVPSRPQLPSEPEPQEPPLDPLTLTEIQPPQVVGGFVRRGDPVVIVFDGTEFLILAVGDEIGAWTLARVDGNSAWFGAEDRSMETRVPIGLSSGNTGMAANPQLGSATNNAGQSNAQGDDANDPPPTQSRPDNPRSARPRGRDNGSNTNPFGTDEITLDHPMVKDFLRSNPQLEQMARDNPAAAQRMLEQVLRDMNR